jgi:hypothetical protein
VRIAYARHGTGPPLVIATCWLSHLQFDWESPVWRHFVADLGEVARRGAANNEELGRLQQHH